MEVDSRVSARQIRQPITSNHDIENAFDSITYSKAAIRNNLIHSFFASRKDGVVPLAMKRVTNDI
jgi:alanyl aminopeptidase